MIIIETNQNANVNSLASHRVGGTASIGVQQRLQQDPRRRQIGRLEERSEMLMQLGAQALGRGFEHVSGQMRLG